MAPVGGGRVKRDARLPTNHRVIIAGVEFHLHLAGRDTGQIPLQRHDWGLIGQHLNLPCPATFACNHNLT